MKLDKDIENIISQGKDFALYRLPLQTTCHFIDGQKPTKEVQSLSRLCDIEGFLISPFSTDGCEKTLLIRGNNLCFELPTNGDYLHIDYHLNNEKSSYTEDFERFSSALRDGDLKKIVLARKPFIQIDYNANETLHFFLKACNLYPRNFVTLWHTSLSGTWLVATPELLLEQEGNTFRTMALAGTRSIHEKDVVDVKSWDAKNRHEQQMVADYISGILNDKGTIVESAGPYPSQSGELMHLRTDYTFNSTSPVGDILSSLHPTPAVCGFPKQIAYNKIVSLESIDREYYAGFCGPLNINKRSGLYVTLRCMKFVDEGAYAYAGGGLLKESTVQEEWNETCRKIETLLKILE